MANNFLHIYFFISSLVVLKIFASDTLLEVICRQTHDSSLCATIIESDPHSATANIYVLAEDMVEMGTDVATGTKVKIHSLILFGKVDPNLRLQLVKCHQMYEDSIGFMRSAGSELKDGNFMSFAQSGALVYASASKCKDELSKPPSNSSMFTTENRRLQTLGEIIYFIGKLLPDD
ncbi:Unknown protein [Striga hermonthica]|uniref:Pectinesterase inhibitor domain-containing protein n=1 Tax=Striga hermonthica TaxID=68872 RepID=A0A9N7NDK4_STRHE|nr:Unknown protein [Striga hermonthica]